jgi:predicted nucleic acid-binding protein
VIVVDSNVLAYLWLPGPQSAVAAECLRRDPHWASPVLWRSEFRNILAGYVRRHSLALPMAMEAMHRAEAMMKGGEFVVASSRVLELVARSKCSAYDCEYVALAEERKLRLVTNDGQIAKEFPAVAVSLEKFARDG